MNLYGFNVGELGLVFLSIVVSLFIAIPLYMLYLYIRVNPSIRANGMGPQEDRLIPALITSIIIPIGLFLFAWTSDGHIHWIVSVIGITIYSLGVFIVVSRRQTS
jgi:DHA1 family multidrug resistance protein-like MFS transporter